MARTTKPICEYSFRTCRACRKNAPDGRAEIHRAAFRDDETTAKSFVLCDSCLDLLELMLDAGFADAAKDPWLRERIKMCETYKMAVAARRLPPSQR